LAAKPRWLESDDARFDVRVGADGIASTAGTGRITRSVERRCGARLTNAGGFELAEVGRACFAAQRLGAIALRRAVDRLFKRHGLRRKSIAAVVRMHQQQILRGVYRVSANAQRRCVCRNLLRQTAENENRNDQIHLCSTTLYILAILTLQQNKKSKLRALGDDCQMCNKIKRAAKKITANAAQAQRKSKRSHIVSFEHLRNNSVKHKLIEKAMEFERWTELARCTDFDIFNIFDAQTCNDNTYSQSSLDTFNTTNINIVYIQTIYVVKQTR
jgi:hypothetical protein